ncbi:unnamed protein product [Soboliphyme baturini]|uniref:LETM1 domain-containing protein n=1 Tax=Soboliphyme baturini TaxID=241478 RepID=A0A183IKM3_9BILA|nr:unnamed protein product [Soboliphyme baturini]
MASRWLRNIGRFAINSLFLHSLPARLRAASDVQYVWQRMSHGQGLIDDDQDDVKTTLEEIRSKLELANEFLPHKVLLIQPHIAAYVQRYRGLDYELLITEAKSLVESVPDWTLYGVYADQVKVNMKSEKLFGSGKLAELVDNIKPRCDLTAIFLNVDRLSSAQHLFLVGTFGMPAFDR